jgi:hypothetical protein
MVLLIMVKDINFYKRISKIPNDLPIDLQIFYCSLKANLLEFITYAIGKPLKPLILLINVVFC